MDRHDTAAAVAPGSGWARLRRPDRLVAQTRWLFTVLALVSVLLDLPGLAGTSGLIQPLLAISAYVGLVAVWVGRYLSGRAPVLLGAVEAVLVLATAVAGPDPASIFTYLFASLWLRALYGSTRGVFVHVALVAVAVSTALLVWPLLPGRPDGPPPTSVLTILSAIPTMFLTAAVARYLVLSLFAREQAQDRDGALLALSASLIGVTEREQIRRHADVCTTAICAATPGLRILVVHLPGVPGDAPVRHHAGDVRSVPPSVPLSALPVDADLGVQPLRDPARLDEVAGSHVRWLAVPLAGDAAGWLLLAGAPMVPEEVLVAVRSMTNTIALALRTSDAHHDLATQASEDPLTGLANRAAFTAVLEAALTTGDARVALLFLDLDDFKIVNDGLGHSAGDDLLRTVAARLRSGVRPGDVCARIGGDEFAVLLPNYDEDATAVGQRLVELIAAPVTLRGRLVHVGASVGLAHAEPDVGGEQLVQRADIAMYAAKAKGKNRVQVFDPSLLQDDGRMQFETELAAAAREGQLVVHYQPIMSVTRGSCVAVEALVRWQHPTRGLLMPADFIPTAERTGAIVEIGALVLRRACADGASWSGSEGPLAVHVNVSAAQLTGTDFVAEVRSCVAGSALEPSRLVLEITEGMVLESPAIRTALEALAELGVAIAIDDFGTGYSALSTLRTLPLDIVKIDKSFLAAGPSRAADEAVVEAIVQMAGRLGLKVVAEGVERVDQQQFLRSVGADAAQGFLHLSPTSAPEFGRWLGQQAGSGEGGSVTPLVRRRLG